MGIYRTPNILNLNDVCFCHPYMFFKCCPYCMHTRKFFCGRVYYSMWYKNKIKTRLGIGSLAPSTFGHVEILFWPFPPPTKLDWK